jgi:glycosyltransferase involved in cell wall biosynthesis
MRIIIVTDYAWVAGGASKVAMLSAIALAHKGHDVYHFSAVGPVADKLTGAPLTVQCLGESESLQEPSRLIGAQKGLWNLRAKSELTRFLKDFSPRDTIVHFHQWTKALSPSVFAPVLEQGFRFVITLHDYFTCCPNGGFLVYSKAEICNRKPLSAACIICNCDPRNYRQKLWRVTRQSIQNRLLVHPGRWNNVIYASEFSRRILAHHLPETLRWYFVPNPIQIDQMPRIEVNQNREYVFVGRLSREKGGIIFAMAAKQANVPAVFIGDGEQRAMILAANADAKITGWLTPGDVYARLARGRALVFPSIGYEVQGLTVCEAASMGLPSIVTERTAAREHISNGENGLYTRTASVDDLAAKLTMLQDDALLQRLSIDAYERYWQNPPTTEEHLRHLEEAYHAIMAQPLHDARRYNAEVGYP